VSYKKQELLTLRDTLVLHGSLVEYGKITIDEGNSGTITEYVRKKCGEIKPAN
jgi:hypothetical protein